MPSRRALVALLVALALAVAGCSSRRPAPVEDRAPAPRTTVTPPPTAPAAARPAAEPDWRPPTYTVKRGDTLFNIALDHGLDYRDIVTWNSIENPNRILVGQVLRLAPPGGEPSGTAAVTTAEGGVVTAPLRAPPPVVETRPGAAGASAAASATPPVARNTENLKASPKAIKEPYSAQAAREMSKGEPPAAVALAPSASPAPAPATPSAAAPASPPAAAPRPEAVPTPAPAPAPSTGTGTAEEDGIEWMWPAKGKIVTGFSDTANLKGIDIGGTAGQPIVASAPGKVVYAGSGLRGYGKLVIIKHNNTYLSAYAHNRDILVKEGQQVTRGQKIAEMGNTDSDQVKLHFEIRRLGKPMDPTRYLPPA